MNLYLLRHGIAEDLTPDNMLSDADRSLTAKGRQKTRRAAQALVALGISFDRILSSPLKRAQQTAEIVARGMNCRKRLELCEHLAPAGDPRKLIETLNRISPAPESVLLVGHEPYLGRLVAMLVFGQCGEGVTIKKGAVCNLEAKRLKYARCATLEWLLTPKQMELMK